MGNFYKRFSVIAGFLVLLVVLIANALIVKRQLDAQVASQVWVTHTQQVLYELGETESLLKDAETGQRGFLYTGREQYLAPYKAAGIRLGDHIAILEALIADNPNQRQRVDELRRLSQNKMQELAATIALYRLGKTDEARRLVLSDAGLQVMQQIRDLVAGMRREELTLHDTRSLAYQRSVRVTIACLYLASLVAVTGLGLLAYLILRQGRLQTQHASQLRAREEWFRVTLTSVGEAVIATNSLGQVTFLNPHAERMIGLSAKEARGRAIEEIFPIFNEFTLKVVENPIKKVMESGAVVGLANHTVLKHRDGSYTPIEDSAAPIWDDLDRLVGVVLVFRDATENRKAHELLRKTEKLAAAARLSATMAHEINNPLEAVANLIYIAKGMDGVPTDAVECLELAEQEVERVSHIARQTLGFYRESNVAERIDIRSLVDSVLKIYSNKFKSKDIAVQCEFEECPPLDGRAGEMKQAIANLIGNAADAVGVHGRITVKLQCDRHETGTDVHLTIEDDGPGIQPEAMDHIFEPFFTTKKDVGTGLGLWVTKEIIDRHGGKIEVKILDGVRKKGAVFVVILPLQPVLTSTDTGSS